MSGPPHDRDGTAPTAGDDSTDGRRAADPAGDDRPAAERPPSAPDRRGRVDSQWWYWIAANAVFAVLAFAAAFFLAFVVLAGGLGVAAGPRIGLPLSISFGVVLFVAIPLAMAGLVLGIALPIALYFDAQAVAAARVGWDPDPALYAAAGLAGLFVQGLQPAVAFYYLYRRHRAVGTP